MNVNFRNLRKKIKQNFDREMKKAIKAAGGKEKFDQQLKTMIEEVEIVLFNEWMNGEHAYDVREVREERINNIYREMGMKV